jgi:molybdopterin-dependent oxidoreductase alpha subunit
MHAGHAKIFFAMGGNFAVATPDRGFTEDALRRCRLTVQVSTKLNRSHLVGGEEAILLPCLGRTERDAQKGGEQLVTVEDSMSLVHASRGHLAPASGELRSEPAIVAGLARAVLGERTGVRWEWLVEDYDRIRDAIERVIPGFEEFNRRVREPGGFVLPNGVRDRRFDTPSGKAMFSVNPLPDLSLGPGELWMMTIRSHDQFNTTVYSADDRYRGIQGNRRVVLLNPDDVRERGLRPGQAVDLKSRFAEESREAKGFMVVPYDLPRGCAATYFPEANPLVPVSSFADESRTPTYKSVRITLRPQD